METSTKKHIVCAYGTLMRNHHNHLYLRSSKFLGKSHTGPGYTFYRSGLPFIYKDPEGIGREVEVYEINDLTLKMLDRLEGNGHFYTRELITLTDGQEAWIYLIPKETIL